MTVDRNDPRLREAAEAYRRRDPNKAAAILESLLAEYPDDAYLLQTLGAVDVQRGKRDSAVAHLERALKIEPENIQALNTLGLLLGNMNRREEARELFQKAIDAHPQIAESHVNLGNLHLARGDVDAARACYEKAVAVRPDFVDALVSLASLLEGTHRFEEARSFARRAVDIAPSHGHANTMLAQIELRMGETQEAIQRLKHLIGTAQMSEFERAMANYVLGEGLDETGDYDEAFSAYEAGNSIFHRLYEPSVVALSSVLAPEFLAGLQRFLADEDFSAWTAPGKMEEPDPVFLLGFPRSGTTLLDQILSAHSAIETLEEKENMADVRNELVRPAGALEKLGRMTDEEINTYRKKYWARAREGFAGAPADGVVIDKMPLNTILLALIYRLFPNAKIIFALRDPRDVVLSCFQQRFRMNAAMFQFLKLDAAAAYYDQVMSIAEVCRDRLPLNIHVVRYEDVVGDMQKTVSDLLTFLGLEWEEGISDYRAQARDRWISTPSAEQVVEPLHAGSVGKWRHYQRHLEPVLPALEPWVKKHGYEAS